MNKATKERALTGFECRCLGIYLLQGRGAGDPVLNTATNFLYAAPLAVAVCLVMSSRIYIAPQGLLLAIASGDLTSGCGYVIW